jgi:Mn-containing catalase
VATALKITLDISNIQHYLVGAQGALPVDAAGNPCSGCYVYNSGNLIAGWWYRCPGAAIVVGVAGDDI